MTSPQEAVSKTPSERRRFIWKIEDFALIRSSTEALEAQNFQFEMGASIGLQTKWKCVLDCKEIDGKVWIGVSVRLDKTRAKGYTEVLAKLLSLKIGTGQHYKGNESPLKNWMKLSIGWGWPKVIMQDSDPKTLPLNDDGSLSLDLEILLVNPKKVSLANLAHLEFQFGAKFRESFQNDMTNMFNDLLDPSSSAPMLVKVVSRDGKECWANRGILAARSPVFLSMFQSPMSEVQEGVIRVDDIPGPALKAVVSFMHTGALPINWKEPEVVEGFTYAAHKYLLQELVEFLDQALGMVMCTPQSCVKLAELAKRQDMKTAEKELTRVLRNLMKDASLDEMRQLLRDGDLDEGVY